MYALLCKPIVVPMSNKSIITTKDCRIVLLNQQQDGKIELEVLEAPPVTVTDEISAKDKGKAFHTQK